MGRRLDDHVMHAVGGADERLARFVCRLRPRIMGHGVAVGHDPRPPRAGRVGWGPQHGRGRGRLVADAEWTPADPVGPDAEIGLAGPMGAFGRDEHPPGRERFVMDPGAGRGGNGGWRRHRLQYALGPHRLPLERVERPRMPP